MAALGYDYTAQPHTRVTACNLCGGDAFTVLAHRDRYGYAATACGCRRCGLVFLDPVMTADAYKRFYIDVYRPLVSAYHGRLIDAKTIQGEQREYAVERGDLVAPYFENHAGGRLLDIGGSTGVVAHALCERFGLTGTVIDPAPLEIDEARRLGLTTFSGLVEDWTSSESFDAVIMCQTVDHLLDIAGALAAVRGAIAADGVFFIDIVDFRAAYLRNWSVEEAVKIDHPYYLTQATMESYLRNAGFAIVRADYAADHLHVGYVCRPATPHERTWPAPDEVNAMFREIRQVQNAPRP
jgi:2-polyprenyl-3-methyl-5-hydroxy-6-metoxy-1,4-benzoquinol methylase